MIQILGYIASFNTILTVWLTGNKSIWIWYLSMFNQCLWFVIGFYTKQYYICCMSIVIQILNIRGLRRWLNIQST